MDQQTNRITTEAPAQSINWIAIWLKKNSHAIALRGYSDKTRQDYNRFLKMFLSDHPKHPTQITEAQTNRWLMKITNSHRYKDTTYNNIIAALKFFYRNVLGLKDREIKFKRKKVPFEHPEIFSKQELAEIFRAETNLKNRLILKAGYAFGLRVNRAVALKLEHFDLKRQVLNIRGDKGKKDRRVMLSKDFSEELRKYIKAFSQSDYLFPGYYPGTHITDRMANKILKNAMKKAGVTRKATFHTLRHSFATHLFEAGYSILTIMELMGHTSIRTTQKYIHVSTRTIKNVISPLDSLEEEK